MSKSDEGKTPNGQVLPTTPNGTDEGDAANLYDTRRALYDHVAHAIHTGTWTGPTITLATAKALCANIRKAEVADALLVAKAKATTGNKAALADIATMEAGALAYLTAMGIDTPEARAKVAETFEAKRAALATTPCPDKSKDPNGYKAWAAPIIADARKAWGLDADGKGLTLQTWNGILNGTKGAGVPSDKVTKA